MLVVLPFEQVMFLNLIQQNKILLLLSLLNDILLSVYVKISLELLHGRSLLKVLISLTSISDNCKNTNVE